MRSLAIILVKVSILQGLFVPSAFAGGSYVVVDGGLMQYGNVGGGYIGVANVEQSFSLGGGCNLNEYSGLEAGHTMSSSSSALRLALVESIPVRGHFGIFGKIGISHTRIHYADATGSGTHMLLGIGWKYNFSERFALLVQYTDFGDTRTVAFSGTANTSTPSKIGMSNYSIGGIYNFY
jgi:hypothetical protein